MNKIIISLSVLMAWVNASEIPTRETGTNNDPLQQINQQTSDELGQIGQALRLLDQGKDDECAALILEIANQLLKDSSVATPPSANR